MSSPEMDWNVQLREMLEVTRPEQARTALKLSSEKFQKINIETRSWVANNHWLCRTHELAVEDYVTARSAVLELGLFSTGLALAAQAIEKYLKCYLGATGMRAEQIRNLKHGISQLLQDAHAALKDDGLTAYAGFCQELEGWYQARYADGKKQASQWYRPAINKLDEMAWYLEEHIPLPVTVEHLRYGGGEMGSDWHSIFVRLFDSKFGQHKAALLLENGVLMPKLAEIGKRYFEDREAAVMPSKTLDEEMWQQSKREEIRRRFDRGSD